MKNKLNRYLNEEKMQKQFEKNCLTLIGTEKTFEFTTKGSGKPTVVLINGAGGPIEGWMKCWPQFDDSITAFAYNRQGIGKSSLPTEPQTVVQMAKDLDQLLHESGQTPPYVLVGHSLGGFIAQAYASMYPQVVEAILFLESSTITDAENAKKDTNGLTEVDRVHESVEQLKALETFPQVQLAVIAGFHPMARMFLPKGRFQKRFENQKKLLELSSNSQLIIATKSGHLPQLSEPRLVVDAIYKLIEK